MDYADLDLLLLWNTYAKQQCALVTATNDWMHETAAPILQGPPFRGIRVVIERLQTNWDDLAEQEKMNLDPAYNK